MIYILGYIFGYTIVIMLAFILYSLIKNRKSHTISVKKKHETNLSESSDEPEIVKSKSKAIANHSNKSSAFLKIVPFFLFIIPVLASITIFFTITLNVEKDIEGVETIVTYKCFVTEKSGGSYHKRNCKYVADKNVIRTTVYDAEHDGYSKCSICDPIYDAGKVTIYKLNGKTIPTDRAPDYRLAIIVSLTIFVFLSILVVVCVFGKRIFSWYKFASANKNTKRLINICEKLIEKYESDVFAKPSCKHDLMAYIKNEVEQSKNEIAEWEDHDTDYIKIAHTMLANDTFDLLTSGKYHIYRGILNPMKCTDSLLKVYDESMSWGVKNGMIDAETKEEQRSYLFKCISEVG